LSLKKAVRSQFTQITIPVSFQLTMIGTVNATLAESFDEVRRAYFLGCAVGGSSPLSRRYIAAEL